MTEKYYWDDWFKNDFFMLRKGRDFFCGITSMIQQIRNAALARGIRVKMKKVDGNDISVRIMRDE